MSLSYNVITLLLFDFMMLLCYDIVTLIYDIITLHYDTIIMKCFYLTFWWHYVMMSFLYDVMLHYDIITIYDIITFSREYDTLNSYIYIIVMYLCYSNVIMLW